MATIICKGTVIQHTVSDAYVALAQVIGLTLPDMEAESFEADTLDNSNAGIPYHVTGRTEGGSLGGELFYDPALQGHTDLLWNLTYPKDENWKIIFADTANSEWEIPGAGVSFGGTIALNDGLKGTFGVKVNGLPTFPGTGTE